MAEISGRVFLLYKSREHVNEYTVVEKTGRFVCHFVCHVQK